MCIVRRHRRLRTAAWLVIWLSGWVAGAAESGARAAYIGGTRADIPK